MTNTDIEEIATTAVTREVLKNRDCMKSYINQNDKTPFWDGSIFIYKGAKKTNDLFEGKIDIQIKGRKVKEFKDINTYSFQTETLQGFSKEKGTLLFVVDIIDDDNYQLYYANLLPVDLFEIFNEILPDQKHISLKLKKISEKGPLSFKYVCLNFMKNAIRQAGKRIISENDFDKIENIEAMFISEEENLNDFFTYADIYTYAKMKDTDEEVIMIKATDFVPFSTLKKDIKIENKIYYKEITKYGNNTDKIVIGPMTILNNVGQVKFNITGNPKKRINDLNFIIKFLNDQYIIIGNEKISFPIKEKEKIIKNLELFNKQLEYFKKIEKIFKYFNTDFDIDYNELSEDEKSKLNQLIYLFEGNFNDSVIDLQKYYIHINKFKFIFVVFKDDKKIINYYSDELLEKVVCFHLDYDNNRIFNSIYSGISLNDILDVNNFNDKPIYKSYKKVDLNKTVIESLNYMLLNFIRAYDITSNKKFIDVADKLNQICYKNDNDDIHIINAKQIKCRKQGISNNDKKILDNIYNDTKYSNNYEIKCCIDILLNNKYKYETDFRQLTKKQKEEFKQFPICNLNK